MAPGQLVLPDPESPTHHLPWLIRPARWLVLGLILLSIVTLLFSIALFPATVRDGSMVGLYPNFNWTPEMTQTALDQLGWSPPALAWFYAILGWITGFVYCVVGLIVFRRKSGSWFRLFTAFTFAVLLTSLGIPQAVREQGGPLLTGWYSFTGSIAWQFLFYPVLPVPRWALRASLDTLVGIWLVDRIVPTHNIPYIESGSEFLLSRPGDQRPGKSNLPVHTRLQFTATPADQMDRFYGWGVYFDQHSSGNRFYLATTHNSQSGQCLPDLHHRKHLSHPVAAVPADCYWHRHSKIPPVGY